MLEFFKNLDRRNVFLLIAISVLLPLISPLGLPLLPDPEVKALYNQIDALPEGSKIALSFDYDPASGPELKPMAEAILHHAFKKKHKVYAMALYPAGPSMANEAFSNVADIYKAEYGEDYINLGFYYGPNTGLNQVAVFCTDIRRAFPVDEKKKPLSSYPMMAEYNSLKDAALTISLSAGDPGVPAYVSVANAVHGLKIGAGVTAVSAPRFYAFYNSGQLVGLLGGLGGAAGYEVLNDIKGKGLSGMDAQSMAHLVIILLIVFSNLLYIIEKKLEE